MYYTSCCTARYTACCVYLLYNWRFYQVFMINFLYSACIYSLIPKIQVFSWTDLANFAISLLFLGDITQIFRGIPSHLWGIKVWNRSNIQNIPQLKAVDPTVSCKRNKPRLMNFLSISVFSQCNVHIYIQISLIVLNIQNPSQRYSWKSKFLHVRNEVTLKSQQIWV